MPTAALRPARMELRTTNEAKQLLNQAAVLDGMDLTAFVLGSAIERARKVIPDHALIALTLKGQSVLADLLNNPPQPTQDMQTLMSLTDFPSRKAE